MNCPNCRSYVSPDSYTCKYCGMILPSAPIPDYMQATASVNTVRNVSDAGSPYNTAAPNGGVYTEAPAYMRAQQPGDIRDARAQSAYMNAVPGSNTRQPYYDYPQYAEPAPYTHQMYPLNQPYYIPGRVYDSAYTVYAPKTDKKSNLYMVAVVSLLLLHFLMDFLIIYLALFLK